MALELDVPLEVSTRGLTTREAHLAKRIVRDYAERLARKTPDIIMCRVAVEKPQKFQQSGNPFRVRVLITAPGHTEVVVVREPGQHAMHDPLRTVIKDAFQAAMRSLDSEMELRRQEVKNHDPEPWLDEDAEPATGFVVRLYREYDYGFLRTPDGREVYFHSNAVQHGDFDRLRVGAKVRFEAEQGEDGPQCTSVQIVEQHGGPLQQGVEDPEGWLRTEE